MGDKETRKRKKRRESAKKEETDDSSPPRDPIQDGSGKKKAEDHSSSHNLNEPSILAKLVFCVLFMLLMSAVGLIFYALNEATKSSDVMEGGAEELANSAALPIIDDLLSGESQPDLVNDDDEGEESHSPSSLEEIMNSIEESVTYNIDEYDGGQKEINIDNLNNEEESGDVIQPEEPPVSEDARIDESVDQQDSVVNQQESVVIRSSLPEELLLPNSVETTESSVNPLSDDEDLFESNERDTEEEIESSTNPPVEVVETEQNNPDTIENNPHMPDNDAFLDDADNEDDEFEDEENAEEEPQAPSPQLESLNVPSDNIEPSSVSQTNEQSEGHVDQDAQVQESVDQPRESPESPPPQYENEDITNDYDFLFREELDEGDKLIEKEPENGDFYFWNF